MVEELESTKSVSEVYSPFAGTIVAVNEALTDSPGSVKLTCRRAGVETSANRISVELSTVAYMKAID
ncbi:MAG: hypothetical protein R2693_08550 [Nocardioidaceae bacterium]